MRTDKISSFRMEVCQSSLQKLEFAIVYPSRGILNDLAGTQKISDIKTILERSYINYHLAIKPEVPVVLFQLVSLHDVGTKVYGGSEGCPEIYHLPPRIYDNLEDVVRDDAFIVSENYLEMVIRAKCLNKSIFGLLHKARQEVGLNVLGICHAATEA